MTNETTGRAHLALRPTQTDTRDADTRYSDGVDNYLSEQKRQQAASYGGRDYLDIDEAYNLGVGVKSEWFEPGASTTTSKRIVDHKHKAMLDELKANGQLSDAAYQRGLEEAGYQQEEIAEDDSPAAGLDPLQYDEETSNNAQWTINQVGESAFRMAMTSYVMGDSTAAMNLADRLQTRGVTPDDITGMYDSMAQTAAGKIAAVMEANGDEDVSVNEVMAWAKQLEPGQQVYHLTRTAMASALFDNFKHVPDVVQKYRLTKRKPR
ncbi:hypothetical protein [Microbulbifer sp. Q7]|uniref:hypothetical protein n=1 Tax=Microbulbifer sp. Q7 TaxID=1785091 RepID=UPI0008301754|nr:hypothetical protein [Microbulbifer sp. Q7]